MRWRKYNPGDEVCILPAWWDSLASGKNAGYNQYVQRGKDYVYIVDRCTAGKVYLVDADGYWDENKLIPAHHVEEPDISIDGLI